MEPFVIIICEKYYDILLFPFDTVDAVHLSQIPLFIDAKNAYDEDFNSLNQPGILIILEFLHVLLSSDRRRIQVKAPDCISNYTKSNMKCCLLDVIKKEDLTEELKEVKYERDNLREEIVELRREVEILMQQQLQREEMEQLQRQKLKRSDQSEQKQYISKSQKLT